MATIDTSEEVRVSAPANPPRENLVRATHGIGLERASGAAMPTLTGHFAVWDQWTEIRSAYEGNFMERFSPTSMSKTLTEGTPKVLFQHGKDPQVGEKPLGVPERVTPDDEGAFYAVPLFDTSYNRDLIPGFEAGVYGSSFRFSVVREDVVQRPKKSTYNPRGIPERTVQEARVMEFGPVTFPAYAGASAGLRSMTDEYLLDTLITGDKERFLQMTSAPRLQVSLSGMKRFDNDDTSCIAQMIVLATNLISEQDENDPVEQNVVSTVQDLVKTLTGLLPGEAAEDEPADEGEYSALQEGEDRSVWTTEYIDNLPDSAFLYIEDGGQKDSDGKTTPRALRHFPYKDSSGAIDLPHLRNALARIPQSDLPQAVKDETTAKAQKILAAENGRNSEPEPSEAATRTEPEPSAATTRAAATSGLYPSNREEKPSWLL